MCEYFGYRTRAILGRRHFSKIMLLGSILSHENNETATNRECPMGTVYGVILPVLEAPKLETKVGFNEGIERKHKKNPKTPTNLS